MGLIYSGNLATLVYNVAINYLYVLDTLTVISLHNNGAIINNNNMQNSFIYVVIALVVAYIVRTSEL